MKPWANAGHKVCRMFPKDACSLWLMRFAGATWPALHAPVSSGLHTPSACAKEKPQQGQVNAPMVLASCSTSSAGGSCWKRHVLERPPPIRYEQQASSSCGHGRTEASPRHKPCSRNANGRRTSVPMDLQTSPAGGNVFNCGRELWHIASTQCCLPPSHAFTAAARPSAPCVGPKAVPKKKMIHLLQTFMNSFCTCNLFILHLLP
jgi:hypothetical protein